MDWREEYQNKITDADRALDRIRSGDRVVVHHAIAEPSHLIQTLIQKKEQYRNVEIVHMVPMGKCEYCKEEMSPYFHHNALFIGGGTRKAMAEGRIDYTPCFFYEVPRFFREGMLPIDVCLLTVTPPDEHGYCSLGVSVDYSYAAAKSAKIVIAQVNGQMPRTYGNSMLHVDEIDAFVRHDEDLIELPPPAIGAVEKAIGEHCAALVEDGDTLQLGIGAIPDAVLLFLKDKKDLGIHSEMISDGVVELVEQGVITNRVKSLNPGKSIVTFLMGTKRLYDFVNNNPSVEMHPVDYVNHPMVIMQNERMVSINSCVQVDLMGQVASETVGRRQISGAGGQVDFVRGVTMAKKGKSIMAMPSTTANGQVSKIVPMLDEGAAVTTTRNDVDYVVTEYGIARLKGRTLRQRGKALIEIAHPAFREALSEAFEDYYRCNYKDVAL